MASCSVGNSIVDLYLVWLERGDIRLKFRRSSDSNVSLQDAEITFSIGLAPGAAAIQTVPPTSIDLPVNTDDYIEATFSVNESLIADAVGVPADKTLFWKAVISTVSGASYPVVGSIELRNSFTAEGAIVEPPALVPRYLTTSTLDPADFDTDGQVPTWDVATSSFIPGIGGGGVGSGITSVNGDTGPAVVLTTSDISEGTNLYYTDARFEAALGAAIATDFSSTIQTSLGLANTSLQPGANISTLTNDAGFTTFDGAYSSLSGIPATFSPAAHTQAISTITGLQDALDDKQPLDTALTQLSGLAVANGQVIGWSGGVLANIAIGGGGDMSKSVYDTDDNGIVDAAESVSWAGVTSPPTTLAGYGITDAFDGAYSSLSGIPATFIPSAHNQAWSTITATPTTLAGYGITDAATSAQGALADTALQPGDAIPQADVTGLVTALGGKADNTITLTAGTGLDGGGNLTTNRSFALDAATLASLNLADSALQSADIANFETTTQLNARDTANRDPDNFSIIADLKTFLNAANTAAAREAIGVADHRFLPAGMTAQFAGNSAPAGWLKMNGSGDLSRTAYADLWAWAEASGMIITDAAWTAGGIAERVNFSSGDGTTTFRIPDWRGLFGRGWDDGRGLDSGRAIGSYQADALQNIVGEVGTFLYGFNEPSGAFGSSVRSVGSSFYGTGGASELEVNFDASRVARTSTETRPVSVAPLWAIKY